MPKRAYKIARAVQKVTSERKHEDLEYSGTVGSAGTVLQCINQFINVGTGPQQRVGDEIRLSSVQINYVLFGADAFNLMRIIVFQWHDDSNAYTPQVTDILDQATAGGTVAASMYCQTFYSRAKSKLFTVLYDKTHSVVASVDASNQIAQKAIVIKKFPKPNVSYTVNNPANNEQIDGIYILVISDSAVVANPQYAIIARVAFYDS